VVLAPFLKTQARLCSPQVRGSLARDLPCRRATTAGRHPQGARGPARGKDKNHALKMETKSPKVKGKKPPLVE